MQDPLKQGLKPNDIASGATTMRIRMQDPLKQGLKHIYFYFLSYSLVRIRMQDPLKQGLKLCEYYENFFLESTFECKIH